MSEQLDQLRSLSYQKGDQQEVLERIRQNVREQGGHIYALVISTDMAAIYKAIERGEVGEWQDLFRQFIDTAQVVY
ncbi:hypothetical protein [Rhizobium sp. PEPV16]|uniref:hypothetical protein n=1 Tax=Rhizobium sp. PEPV16 TaxID=1820614 RepID=UPI00124E40F3|nr:hypothetical protein [Rhizobium sp. PEPV16]KAF5883589.1 hypothetical protein FY112_19705 [Rhizobium sp. PEPV16]